VTIVNPDRIYVLSTIDEVDVGRLRLEQPVTITVDAFPGEKFAGTTKRISPIVSGGKLETRTADVWIYFNENRRRSNRGCRGRRDPRNDPPVGPLHPFAAVIEREGKKQVFVATGRAVKAGDKAVARLKPVEIGETNWSFTEVKKGLAAGEFIITTRKRKD